MTRSRWTRIALGYLAVVSLEVGMWAQFAPRSFYDRFPGFGRTWVSADGPFNEHLVRDVGGLNLALAAVLIAAAITLMRPMVVTASVAALLYGVPHVVYHIAHTERLAAGDIAAIVGGLAMFAVLPIVLIAQRPAGGAATDG
jgi:hypothetical protein